MYATRDALGTRYRSFATEQEAIAIASALAAAEDWLYDEGADAPTAVYVAKLEELQAPLLTSPPAPRQLTPLLTSLPLALAGRRRRGRRARPRGGRAARGLQRARGGDGQVLRLRGVGRRAVRAH